MRSEVTWELPAERLRQSVQAGAETSESGALLEWTTSWVTNQVSVNKKIEIHIKHLF